jgi:hypothetical protein
MAITDAELEELLEMLDQGRQAWITGELDFGQSLRVDQDPDMTIFGPWGGEAGRGPGLPDRQKAMAKLFKGGTGHNEVVKTIVSGDVVVVVLLERSEVIVEGAESVQSWVLRTTQVFERRESAWVRLHRHADPLIERRSPTDTFAIARGGA